MSGNQYTLTANFGLIKSLPTMDADAWGGHMNSNLDQIDELLAVTDAAGGASAANIVTPLIASGSLTLDQKAGGVFRVNLDADITMLLLANVAAGYVTTCQLELLGDGTQRNVNFGTWTLVTGTPVATSAIGRKDIYDIRADGRGVLVWLTAQNVPA